MSDNMIDGITGIYNEEYLKRNYQSYIDNNPNANFIMIDFEKFKAINDTFGHNVGDNYLRIFAKILKSNFKNSIVVRLHGDEFAVLTKFTEDEIDKIFNLCSKKISLAVLEGLIPKIFKFNAGSTKAEHSINITKDKADIMMYYAKKHGFRFQRFDESIFQEKIVQNDFLRLIDMSLKQDDFSYSVRQLFNRDCVDQDIFQIYTRDKSGNSLFNNSNYDILRKTSKIQQFDIYNIQNLLESITFHDQQVIITIDYRTLISIDNLQEYFLILKDISHFPFENVILSIDLSGIEMTHYQKIIEKVNNLKKLGFKVRLDKFDNLIGDILWEESNVDFIKFSNSYWKRAMSTSKTRQAIESKARTCDGFSIIPIFEFIEKEEEYDFLRNLTPDNTLFSGNYFSKEKSLIFRK